MGNLFYAKTVDIYNYIKKYQENMAGMLWSQQVKQNRQKHDVAFHTVRVIGLISCKTYGWCCNHKKEASV